MIVPLHFEGEVSTRQASGAEALARILTANGPGTISRRAKWLGPGGQNAAGPDLIGHCV